MLPKKNRLNLKKSYSFVKAGESLESINFRFYYRFGNNSHPLVGISVSTKTFKNAVDRNRARRLLSSAFENVYQSLPETINIVALPKGGILSKSAPELKKELQPLLGNL